MLLGDEVFVGRGWDGVEGITWKPLGTMGVGMEAERNVIVVESIYRYWAGGSSREISHHLRGWGGVGVRITWKPLGMMGVGNGG